MKTTKKDCGVNAGLVNAECSNSENQYALVQDRSNLKHLIVTLALHNVIPAWTADVLLKWGRLEDA